jgi:hypothetical protein
MYNFTVVSLYTYLWIQGLLLQCPMLVPEFQVCLQLGPQNLRFNLSRTSEILRNMDFI